MHTRREPGRVSSRHLWSKHRESQVGRGQMLLHALAAKAAEENCSEQEVADALEIPSHYLLELLKGFADIELITHEVAEGFARYLGWPTFYVKFAAGQIRWQDFFTKAGLGRALSQARSRWHELEGSPSAAAVLANVLCGERLMCAEELCELVVNGPD